MDSRLINAVKVSNLLSFGPNPVDIPLRPLNVLIGPNGSGKSNLIEIISLFQAMPGDLMFPIRKGGGIRDWLWKGDRDAAARIEASVEYPGGKQTLRHALEFTSVSQRFLMLDECVENSEPDEGQNDPCFYYRYQNSYPVISPDQYPELTWLGDRLGKIRIYREWAFGRHAPLRQPQEPDAPNDFLAEDCGNLGLILNRMKREPKVKRRVIELLGEFYDGIEDFDVIMEGGSVQVFLQEGDFSIPATRLSDGTLRYLCLLAVLCHSNLPPLICIEEPELGIHTDIIPVLAALLKEASARTQLIVTTHSDALVDEFSDTPESVLVCEKHDGCTEFRRLEQEALREWLQKYSLGELWNRGEIGGNRW